jgi:hypothetical protein
MDSCCQGSCHGDYHHRRHGHLPDFRRPLVLIGSVPRNRQTGVSPSIKAIKLIFGRDFNTDRCLINVENVIDMWQGMNQVPIRIKRVADKQDGHRVLLVIPLIPLIGGVTYKVRVRSVFVYRNGDKVTKCRLIVFSTGCR